MKNKFKKLLVTTGLLAALGAFMPAMAQTTNNLFAGTNAANNSPYYSLSNYFSVNAAQVLYGDVISNALTYYYTNTIPTNYTTGAQVFAMGAPKSLNVAFSLTGSVVSNSVGAGTNLGIVASIDAGTGLGDWYPFTNMVLQTVAGTGRGLLPTNGMPGSISINVNAGGFAMFRLNNLAITNTGSATTLQVANNFAYSCKNGL